MTTGARMTVADEANQGRTIDYVAARLGVCRRSVYHLIARGVLRTYRVGRARRCTDDAINDAIAQLEAAAQRTDSPLRAV